jgi:hypothetical protein
MLIGITGKKRSGKDMAGFYLRDKYGFRKARPLAIFKELDRIMEEIGV